MRWSSYNVQQQDLICLYPIQLSSQPTQLIWCSPHVLCRVLWGRIKGEAFCKSKTLLESLRCGCPWTGLIHCTITACMASIIAPIIITTCQRERFIHRKSAVLLTDVGTLTSTHAPTMCLLAASIGSWPHAANSSCPHLIHPDATAPYELEWQAICLFSSSRWSPFPVLPLF